MELFKDFGIWKIVAHIAFKFYSGACETFSTGSTTQAQRPGARDAWIATTALRPGSLERMVRPRLSSI